MGSQLSPFPQSCGWAVKSDAITLHPESGSWPCGSTTACLDVEEEGGLDTGDDAEEGQRKEEHEQHVAQRVVQAPVGSDGKGKAETSKPQAKGNTPWPTSPVRSSVGLQNTKD